MKKKILALITAIVIAFSVMAGLGVFYAATLDFTPNTPIEFHDMNKILFFEKEFTTRKTYDKLPAFTDDWKYYYWCDFKPQYTADYSFNVRSQFRMKCEIYDDNNNLLSAGNSIDKLGDDGFYHFDLTYRLEEGKQYYFKFAFTEGKIDAVGKFWVYFSSNGSDKVLDADNLHLYVNSSSTAYTYYIEDYSVAQLFQDLEFVVVYKNGSFAKWISRETPIQALNGVDILLNTSDCKKEPGQHTVVAHYLGYEVKATFNIVECNHQFKASDIVYPKWTEQGSVSYKCDKCGKKYKEYTLTAEKLKPLVESSLNSKIGDENFNEQADINKDGVINARDVAVILKAYDEINKNPNALKGYGISQTF